MWPFSYNTAMSFLGKSLNASTIMIIIGVLLIATFVRSMNLSEFRTTEADEETWVMSGISLLTKGQPQSWTVFWDTYGSYEGLIFGGKEHVVVTPYLDHPPAFQIFIGSWALLSGNDGITVFNWSALRIPMIVIAVLTIGITSIFVSRVFGADWGVLTCISFSALPSHILSSRIIAAENLLALLLMSALLLTFLLLNGKYEKEINQKTAVYSWQFWLIVGICFIAPLVKLSGIVIPLSIGLLFLAKHRYRLAIYIGIALLASIVSFIAYGCFYNCSLFWSVLVAHGTRPQTFWYFFTLFEKPDLGYYFLNDPMVLVGLVGSIAAYLKKHTIDTINNNKIFLFVPWLMLVCLFVTLAPASLYGWYKFIIFPLIAIGIGYVWQQLLKGEIGWFLLMIPAQLVLIENVFLPEDGFSVVRKIITVILFVPVILGVVKPEFLKGIAYQYYIYSMLCISILLQLLWSKFLLVSL